MKNSVCFRISLIIVSVLVLMATAALGQDLIKQKNDKTIKLAQLDQKLKSASAEEYEGLMKQREQIVADIKKIQGQIMSDAAVVKRMNAVKRDFNEAVKSLRLKDYPKAIEFSDKVVAQDSEFAKAYYVKAFAHRALRQYKESVAAAENAVRLNPTDVDAAVVLAKGYVSLNQKTKGIKVLEELLADDNTAAKAYYALGEIYQKDRNYAKAALNFTRATSANPEYDLAFFSLGVSQIELSKLDQAVMSLESALAVTKRKRWANPHYRLAVALNKKRQASKALSAAQDALGLKKNYYAASFEAGRACVALGRETEGLKYFRAAAKSRVWKRPAEYEIDLIVNKDKYSN